MISSSYDDSSKVISSEFCEMASLVRAPLFLDPPEARTGFCMVLHQNNVYFWGGFTQELVEDTEKKEFYPVEDTLPNTDDNFMDVYSVVTNSWHRHETTAAGDDDEVPDYGKGSAMVAYREHLYLFGGWNEGDFTSEVHQLDIDTFQWKHLKIAGVVKPSPRYLTDTVVFKSKMCVFGGVGSPIDEGTLQQGAKFIEFRQFEHSYGFGWNNEMFFFDLEMYTWSVPTLASDFRPPPCAGFSFNMVDSHRALLFGGKQEKRRVSDIYIFDFHALKWSNVITQRSPEEVWPAGRVFHSATCLVDPTRIEEYRIKLGPVDQQLLVLWGKGDDNKHCKDTWTYNLRTKRWKKCETDLEPRMWHMACAHFTSTTQGTSILFGGNKQRKSNQEKHVMSDLTLFSFGVPDLQLLCMESIRRYELNELLDKKASYVIRNQYKEHTDAHFHHLT